MPINTPKFLLVSFLFSILPSFAFTDDQVFTSIPVLQGEVGEVQLSQSLTSCMQVQYQKIVSKFFKSEPQCEKFTQPTGIYSFTKLYRRNLSHNYAASGIYLTPNYANNFGYLAHTLMTTFEKDSNGNDILYKQYLEIPVDINPTYISDLKECLNSEVEPARYVFTLPLPSLKADNVVPVVDDFGTRRVNYSGIYFQYDIRFSHLLEATPLYNYQSGEETRLYFNANEYITCVKTALNPQK